MNEPRLRGQSTWTAIGLFAVLAAAAVLTPLTGLVIWVMPVPFIVFIIQNNRTIPILLAVATALVLVLSGLGIGSVFFALGVYLVGWVMGEAMQSSDSAFPSLITGTLVFIMMSLVGLAFLYWSGIHLQAEFLKQSELSLRLYQPELHLSPAQIDQTSSDLAARMTMALPAILVVLSFLISVLNYVFARLIVNSPKVSMQPLLSAWRMPSSVIWVYIVATFCVVFGVGQSTRFWWSTVNNAFILTGFFIAVQGVSFIWRRIRHIRTRYMWLAAVVIAAVLLNSIFILIGLLDSVLSRRRLG